jgi:hypothetical protein
MGSESQWSGGRVARRIRQCARQHPPSHFTPPRALREDAKQRHTISPPHRTAGHVGICRAPAREWLRGTGEAAPSLWSADLRIIAVIVHSSWAMGGGADELLLLPSERWGSGRKHTCP